MRTLGTKVKKEPISALQEAIAERAHSVSVRSAQFSLKVEDHHQNNRVGEALPGQRYSRMGNDKLQILRSQEVAQKAGLC